VKSKKPNGMPAFAGMTIVFIESFFFKNNCHAREGGHPIFSFEKHEVVRTLILFFDSLWHNR
jgi:hypothetical protein